MTDHDFPDDDATLLAPKGFYPHVQIPTWILLAPLSTNARCVVGFIQAHLDTSSGRMDAWPGKDAIAEFLGRGISTARNAVRELEERGVVEVVDMYLDWETGERTRAAVRAGRNNDQTSNGYRVVISPPGGMRYAGPLSTREFHDQRAKRPKGEIAKRIADAVREEGLDVGRGGSTGYTGGVQLVARGSDQRQLRKSQVTGGSKRLNGGGAVDCTGGVQSVEPKVEPGEVDQEQAGRQPGAEAKRGGVRGADEPKDPARLPAVEEPKDAQDAGPQTPGAVLLRELELDEPVSEQVVCTWYRRVDELLETWSAEELTRYLVREAGSGKPRSRMAVLAALVKNLRPKTVKTNLTPSLPPLCSKCEEWEPAAARNPKLRLRRDRWGRPVLGDDGLAQRCAECHPDSGELPHAQTA